MQFALKLLINRDYAFLWARRTVSNLSDWVFVTSVTLWIATGIAGGQSWAPLAVGGAGIAVAVLTVSIGPLAGVFVDPWDKRRMMIAADLIRFGLMAALILVPTVGTSFPQRFGWERSIRSSCLLRSAARSSGLTRCTGSLPRA